MFSRTTAGFLIAPLVIAIGMLLTSELELDSPSYIVFALVVWYIYPLFFALIFALPLYLLLNRFNLVRWWVSVGAGLLIAGIGAMSINGQTEFFYTKLVVLGGVAGLAFWFIAKYENATDDSLGSAHEQ